MRLLLPLLLSGILFAADPVKPIDSLKAPAVQPERFPIPAEYKTLHDSLMFQVQELLKPIQAAEEKLRAEVCASKSIPLDKCDVNWTPQVATFGAKPEPPKPAVPPVKPPSTEKK